MPDPVVSSGVVSLGGALSGAVNIIAGAGNPPTTEAWQTAFESALPYRDFLERHGTADQRKSLADRSSKNATRWIRATHARAGAGRNVVRRLREPVPDL